MPAARKSPPLTPVIYPSSAPAADAVAASDKPGQGRWLAYSYIQWRAGSTGASLSGTSPAYGGSQIFGRLSFRIGRDPEESRLALYLRASAPLAMTVDSEQALGVEVRPVGGLPVSLHAERRIRALRPAATALFLSGGFVEDRLPFGARLSTFGQAGALVDGPDGFLPFYDGQADLVAPVMGRDAARLSVGAKLSGGGQGSTARLDFGPVIVADIPWKDRHIRAEAGWRVRVAGNAEPGGGPAVTLGIAF